MKKLTYAELRSILCSHNSNNDIQSKGADKKPICGVIVFKSENWPDKDYSLESRSYRVSSDNKAFIPNMGGYSIFASSLDGSDPCVRLEAYMKAERGGENGWEVDYCYLEENDNAEA